MAYEAACPPRLKECAMEGSAFLDDSCYGFELGRDSVLDMLNACLSQPCAMNRGLPLRHVRGSLRRHRMREREVDQVDQTPNRHVVPVGLSATSMPIASSSFRMASPRAKSFS